MEEESNDALCNKGDFVLSGFSILFLFKILKSVYNDSIAHYIFYIVLFIFVVLLFFTLFYCFYCKHRKHGTNNCYR